MLECSEQTCCPARGQNYDFFKVSPVLTQKTNILATNGGRACLCNGFVENRGTCNADQ